jgi:hypothetical protein
MSRSNSKVAIQLRESDTIRTNKAVLKAGGLAYNPEVFDVLENSSTKYEDKMASLLKFNSRNKKTLKVSTHKMEWLDEQTRLQNLANKIELSVGSILDTAIAQSPDDEALHELMDIMNGYHNARKKNQTDITNQFHNIKEMLKESRRRAAREMGRSGSDKTGEAAGDNTELSATQAFIAELFVNLRTDQAKVWQYWLKQEKTLRKEVQQSSVQLANAVRADNIAVQDSKLREEFAAILSSCSVGDTAAGDADTSTVNGTSSSYKRVATSTGDSVCGSLVGTDTAVAQRLEADLELAMDEWLHKVSLLDKVQELRVIERESEKVLALQELGLSGAENSAYGGWSENDHDTFVKVYRKAQVKGTQRKQLLQFLIGELPTRSQDDIVLHEEWYRKMKFIANKYKESEVAYTAARAELIADAKTALREYRDQRLETLEREREAEIHEKRRGEIHERLQEMLAQKEVLDADQRAERQKQEAALREKLAAQEEALRQERSEKKQQVLCYHQLWPKSYKCNTSCTAYVPGGALP